MKIFSVFIGIVVVSLLFVFINRNGISCSNAVQIVRSDSQRTILSSTSPVPVSSTEKDQDSPKPFVTKSETQSYIDKGFKLVFSEELKRFQKVKLSSEQETSLKEKGYDLDGFKTRQIPQGWTLDIDSLPQSTKFQSTSDGFLVDTGTGNVLLAMKKYDSWRYSYYFEITIKNESEENDCEIELGVYGTDIIKTGYRWKKKEKLEHGQEKTLHWESNVYDRFPEISPSISLKGIATIKGCNIYRYDHKEITLVEGKIVARSPLPDPETTDYSDCRFTAHFIGNSIVSGNPCNKELVLSVDGFIDKKVLPSNELKRNSLIKCAIVQFDSVPEDLSGTQEADTLSLYDLDSYLLLSYKTIGYFSDYSDTNTGVTFADEDKKYVSIFDRHINTACSEEEINSQKEAIEKDLMKLEKFLQPYSDENKQKINSEFKVAWGKEKAKDKPGANRIGKYVWRNMDNSFYVLPDTYNLISDYPEISQRNINALVALKDYLESQGVQLIISPVPYLYDISARVINPDFRKLPDFRTAHVVKQLLENGIETIYASDEIIAHYNKYETPFFYPADAHPGDLPQDVLSDLIVERLSRFHFSREMDQNDFQIIRNKYSSTWMQLSNYSFPDNCDIGDHHPGDFYSFNHIQYQNQDIKSLRTSPVLVLGNSYSGEPEPLSNYLCMKLGFNVYRYSIAGSGILVTAIQRLFNHPETFLTNKKALILSLGTIHLTEDIVFPNIRDLDSDAARLSNAKLVKTIELEGTEKTIPSFAQQLSNPAVFKTDENGICSLLDDPNIIQSSLDPSKEGFAVVYYSFPASSQIELVVNDLSYPLVGISHSSVYFRQLIPIQHNRKSFSLKFIGKPNSLFAIGQIQIYQ